jgi:hypothetical protein
MSANVLPWFRMYHEVIDDEKIGLLAFEDRWHFVAILCLKQRGVLDAGGPLMMRKVATKLGVTAAVLDEVIRRLSEVGLIDPATLQPLAWEARQMRSDSSTERVRAYRERMKQGAKRDGNGDETLQQRPGNGAVTPQEGEGEGDREGGKTHTPPDGGGAPPAGGGEPDDQKSLATLDKRALVRRGVKAQHAADWLTARRAKRLPLTLTAWEGVEREAEKAGLTPAQAVEVAAEMSWAGFKASWIAKAEREAGGAWWTNDGLMLAKAVAVGVGPALAGESRDAWKARINAAIDNGGTPPTPRPVPVAPTDPVPPRADAHRAPPSAASRAALAGAKDLLKRSAFGGTPAADQPGA